MRLLTKINDTIMGGDFLVKVYKDTEWNEYVCRLFVNGTEMVDSAYHTEDLQDALDTASSMLGFYRVRADLMSVGAI